MDFHTYFYLRSGVRRSRDKPVIRNTTGKSLCSLGRSKIKSDSFTDNVPHQLDETTFSHSSYKKKAFNTPTVTLYNCTTFPTFFAEILFSGCFNHNKRSSFILLCSFTDKTGRLFTCLTERNQLDNHIVSNNGLNSKDLLRYLRFNYNSVNVMKRNLPIE